MAKARKTSNGFVLIKCPGCGERHALNIDPSAGRPCWGFNGDLDRPTFTPSLLVNCGHYVTGQPQPPDCTYCKDAAEGGYTPCCVRCHSFIRDGQIEFLSDSTHALAGQTVPLPDWG